MKNKDNLKHFLIDNHRIIHKKSGRVIADLKNVSHFYEVEGVALMLQEKKASYYNLAFDLNGNKLFATGNKNIEIIAGDKSYIVRTIPLKERLLPFISWEIDFATEKSYRYPVRQTDSFFINYNEKKDIYQIALHDSNEPCIDVVDYNIYQTPYGEYIAGKNSDNTWTLYDDKGVPETGITNVSIISRNKDEDGFFVGASRKRIFTRKEQENSCVKKKVVTHKRKNFLIFGISAALMSCLLSAKFISDNKEKQEIDEKNALFTYIDGERIYFDIDGNLSNNELVACVPDADKLEAGMSLQRCLDKRKKISAWRMEKGLKYMQVECLRTKE